MPRVAALRRKSADDDSREVLVEDWDLLSANDFLGRVDVPLRALADKRRVVGWWPLRDDTPKKKGIGKGGKGGGGGGGGGGGAAQEGGGASGGGGEAGEVNHRRGQVQLVLRWVYNALLDHFAEEPEPFPDKPPNELRVALLQARE